MAKNKRYNNDFKKKMYEDFKLRVEKEDYIMISKSSEYINAKSKLEMLCPEMHHISINRNNWISNKRCSPCSRGYRIVNNKRKCVECGKWLSLNNFHKGKTKCKECRLEYQRTDNGKKEQRKRNKKWEQNRKGKYFIEKTKLTRNISRSIRESLKGNKNGKHWEDIVGFTLQEFKKYFKRLFKEGMTWKNYGKWHIDHIRPISSFNITTYDCDDFKKCWSLSNLQPLWAVENIRKGNKWNGIIT